MESASGGVGYGDQVAVELARVREALDDLRRRPLPPDADTLRHVVTASLSEASAPPPNLLVTAIRRLDRVDARLESIEAVLGGPGAVTRQVGPGSSSGRARAPTVSVPATVPSMAPLPDPEAIAEALARRLAGVFSAPAPAVPGGGGATIDDLLSALRPYVPDAARGVLRRAGREPSPQAVEVLQQTALSALEDAARSLGLASAPSAFSPPAEPRPLAAPPPALPPAPTPLPSPPPAPLDVEALASRIAAQVAGALRAELRPAASAVEEPTVPPEHQAPPAEPVDLVDPADPSVVADAVVRRLAEQPPPQAVVSPMAMAPLLSAVGNVEAAVARLAAPDADVVASVDRLEAGVQALAHALEEDRSTQVDEVRRGFAEVNELVRAELAEQLRSIPVDDYRGLPAEPAAGEPPTEAGDERDHDSISVRDHAVIGVQRRLDRLIHQLGPLEKVDLVTTVPSLAVQGQRLERSLANVLTALAALAEHLRDQSTVAPTGVEGTVSSGAHGAAAADSNQFASLLRSLGDLIVRIDELAADTAADRQRFQRLGGTIDGLAELIGQVSERLDRLPRALASGNRLAPPQPASAFARPHLLPDGTARETRAEADDYVPQPDPETATVEAIEPDAEARGPKAGPGGPGTHAEDATPTKPSGPAPNPAEAGPDGPPEEAALETDGPARRERRRRRRRGPSGG